MLVYCQSSAIFRKKSLYKYLTTRFIFPKIIKCTWTHLKISGMKLNKSLNMLNSTLRSYDWLHEHVTLHNGRELCKDNKHTYLLALFIENIFFVCWQNFLCLPFNVSFRACQKSYFVKLNKYCEKWTIFVMVIFKL